MRARVAKNAVGRHPPDRNPCTSRPHRACRDCPTGDTVTKVADSDPVRPVHSSACHETRSGRRCVMERTSPGRSVTSPLATRGLAKGAERFRESWPPQWPRSRPRSWPRLERTRVGFRGLVRYRWARAWPVQGHMRGGSDPQSSGQPCPSACGACRRPRGRSPLACDMSSEGTGKIVTHRKCVAATATDAITGPILALASAPSRLYTPLAAALRPRRGAAGLSALTDPPASPDLLMRDGSAMRAAVAHGARRTRLDARRDTAPPSDRRLLDNGNRSGSHDRIAAMKRLDHGRLVVS